METIKFILSLILVAAAVAAGILVMLFPLLFDSGLKKQTGSGIVNYLLTGLQIIFLIGALDPVDPAFESNLGVFAIAEAIAGIIIWKKAKKRKLDKKTAICAVMAQMLSPVSILVIAFMISSAVKKIAGRRREQEK